MTSEPINRLQQRRIRCEQRRKLPVSIQKRNAQVLRHCGLAHLATHRQLGRGCGEHDDLLQEAFLGLIQGSERFKASRGNRFSSYAMRLATGRIQHFRRDRVRCLRIPWRLDALHTQAIRLQEQRAHAQRFHIGFFEHVGRDALLRVGQCDQRGGAGRIVDRAIADVVAVGRGRAPAKVVPMRSVHHIFVCALATRQHADHVL